MRKGMLVNLVGAGVLTIGAIAFAAGAIDIWTDFDADKYVYVDDGFNGNETVKISPRYSSRTESIELYVTHTVKNGSNTEDRDYKVEAFAERSQLPLKNLKVFQAGTQVGSFTIDVGDKQVTTDGYAGTLAGEFDGQSISGDLNAVAVPE